MQMKGEYSMSEFPSGVRSALTMLYLQNQNISDLTPAQLMDKYFEVYEEIDSRCTEVEKQKSKESHDKFYGR